MWGSTHRGCEDSLALSWPSQLVIHPRLHTDYAFLSNISGSMIPTLTTTLGLLTLPMSLRTYTQFQMDNKKEKEYIRCCQTTRGRVWVSRFITMSSVFWWIAPHLWQEPYFNGITEFAFLYVASLHIPIASCVFISSEFSIQANADLDKDVLLLALLLIETAHNVR